MPGAACVAMLVKLSFPVAAGWSALPGAACVCLRAGWCFCRLFGVRACACLASVNASPPCEARALQPAHRVGPLSAMLCRLLQLVSSLAHKNKFRRPCSPRPDLPSMPSPPRPTTGPSGLRSPPPPAAWTSSSSSQLVVAAVAAAAEEEEGEVEAMGAEWGCFRPCRCRAPRWCRSRTRRVDT